MPTTTYQKTILIDINREVLVKGPETVADELGISVLCVRQLAPEEARRWDEAKKKEEHMKINPITESVKCPHCQSHDVRFFQETGCWRCNECGQRFEAHGGPNGFWIKEIESSEHREE